MKKHKLLAKLLTAAILFQGTVTYASATGTINTYINNINNTPATGNSVTAGSVTGNPATDKNSILKEETMPEPVQELKPGALRPKSLRKAEKTESIYDNKTYTHQDVFDGMNIYNGIDVSYYNKTIDWEEVKAAGTDFAIIRVGYRGYGAAGTLCTDTKFTENIEGALEAGLKIGVYYFTEAVNKQEAIEEAEYCLEKIQDYDVTLPVVIDYEYPTNSKGPVGRMYNAKLSKSAATNNVSAFCDTVKNAGYTPMVYANKSDFSSLINGTKLAQKYKIWLANYTTSTTYPGTYEYWQYSSKGKVDGISGNVDCNFWYTDSTLDGSPGNNTDNNTDNNSPDNNQVTNTTAPTATPVAAIDLSDAVISVIEDKTYTGSEITPSPEVWLNDTTLTESEDYEITYEDNVGTGKATVTITGIGNYTGSITSGFLIKPAKPGFLSFKPASKNIKLSWDSDNGADGYEIYRKDTYNGSYTQIKTITDGDTSSYKNTKLLTDHEYYYRIRSYAKINDNTYYSNYATVTAATMKSKQAAVNSKKIKLLKTPAPDAAPLVTVPKNSTMEYLGKTYLNDNSTYLHFSYVVQSKKYNGYLASKKSLKFYSSGKTTADLNMRKAAGTNKKILTVIPTGTPVAILKKVNVKSKVWYKTNYFDGSRLYTGFVSSSYIN